jgi:hypothetical protein
MVRPERVELPTYWFVASRSIQLSYGRTRLVSSETIDRISGFIRLRNRSLSGCGGRAWSERRNLRQSLREVRRDLQSSLANEFGDGGGVKPGGVVLHAQRMGHVIEAEPADAVDVLCAGQRGDYSLTGRRNVGQENFHRGHRGMIPRRQALKRDPAR